MPSRRARVRARTRAGSRARPRLRSSSSSMANAVPSARSRRITRSKSCRAAATSSRCYRTAHTRRSQKVRAGSCSKPRSRAVEELLDRDDADARSLAIRGLGAVGTAQDALAVLVRERAVIDRHERLGAFPAAIIGKRRANAERDRTELPVLELDVDVTVAPRAEIDRRGFVDR